MGLVAAGFSALARGAGDIKITEGNEIEAGVLAIVGENFFKGELGFAVGIDGRFGMVFMNERDTGLAVDGAGGREDQILDAVTEHGVDKDDAAGDVGDVEGAGILHGFFDEGLAREMHDGVDAMALEDFIEVGGVAEVGFAKLGLRRNGGAMAFAEVVEGDDVDAGGDEEFGADAADVAGAAGHENVQARVSLRPCLLA